MNNKQNNIRRKRMKECKQEEERQGQKEVYEVWVRSSKCGAVSHAGHLCLGQHTDPLVWLIWLLKSLLLTTPSLSLSHTHSLSVSLTHSVVSLSVSLAIAISTPCNNYIYVYINCSKCIYVCISTNVRTEKVGWKKLIIGFENVMV